MTDVQAVTLRDAEALVGLPYVPGYFDCAHLTLLVQERLFGRRIDLALRGGRHPRGARGQAAAFNRLRGELAERVEPPELAATGDGVLFAQATGNGTEWHLGTLFVAGGERWVLHAHASVDASVLERLSDCQRRCLVAEGFYRWNVEQGQGATHDGATTESKQ